MSAKTEALEAQIEARRAARAAAEETQYELDLEARITLEEQYGNIGAVKVAVFTPGQPTRAYVRPPTGAEYKRYKAQIFKVAQSKGGGSLSDAQELLARSCWVYPAGKEAQDGMLEAFAGLLTPIAQAATALAEGKTDDEGKG